MKSVFKTEILLIFGIISALLLLITNNHNLSLGNTDKSSYDIKLKVSKISGKIHINGSSDWIDFQSAGNCTGQGTYSDPYVIEDLVIDGGGSGDCITIENSNAYFRIENCTVFNSGWDDSGIRLSYVNNSQLIDNNCSSNYYGIFIYSSKNNTIMGNTADYTADGIRLSSSDNNTILGNNLSHNNFSGIHLFNCEKNNISNNVMNKCGLFISSSISGSIYGKFHINELYSHNIDTTNLVNEKPLYYYVNKTNLNSNNFTNAGQIILVNCSKSLISNSNVSYSSMGISLFYSKNNSILGNFANYNRYGIFLYECRNNTISNNQIKFNSYGLFLNSSNNNEISGNSANYNGYGISLYECSNNTISGNLANNNIYGWGGAGIFIYGFNNVILLNSANNNGEYGIGVWGDKNLISGNVASYNSGIQIVDPYFGVHIYGGIGIYLVGSNNTILENTANNNNENGIRILFKSYYNTILDNTASNNNWNGISLQDCDNNKISRNTVNINEENGIFLRECYNNTISENDVNFNGNHGINLHSSDNNIILKNTVTNNNNYGIYLEAYSAVGCYNNTILGNIVENNQYGISLEICHNNDILDNIVHSNSQNGIHLYQSDNNNILNNNVSYNGANGLFLSQSDTNLIAGNSFIDNKICIVEINCQGNIFENNYCEEQPSNGSKDSGNNLIILIAILSFVALFGTISIIVILLYKKQTKVEN
ncbi:MAG: right-handed parallel beta-helix repeat-containing protein [Candidatus Hermodarchaeota archaeon]